MRGVPRNFRFSRVLAIGLLVAVPGSAVWAEEFSRQQMKGLDEQVQEIKSDVLGISAELSRLEERLLYPSDTQVSVFVSVGKGETFRLDALHVHINGTPVAHHIYSHKELDALRNGGVQRVYTGNIPTGEHDLEVSLIGKLDNGRDYTRSENYRFTKDANPTLLGITLAGPDAGRDGIRIGAW